MAEKKEENKGANYYKDLSAKKAAMTLMIKNPHSSQQKVSTAAQLPKKAETSKPSPTKPDVSKKPPKRENTPKEKEEIKKLCKYCLIIF